MNIRLVSGPMYLIFSIIFDHILDIKIESNIYQVDEHTHVVIPMFIPVLYRNRNRI